MHHIIILDPGIGSHQLNFHLNDSLKNDVFIKNATGQPLEGKV